MDKRSNSEFTAIDRQKDSFWLTWRTYNGQNNCYNGQTEH